MKKQELKRKLAIHKMNIASLNPQEMVAVVAGGPRRSRNKDGDCRYSRNHYTQCTSANKHSRTSVCAECPNG